MGDGLLPVAKDCVSGLDKREDGFTVSDPGFRDVGEDRIALQFVDGQQLFQAGADRPEQVAEDLLRMLQLGLGYKGGVPRDIGQDEVTALGEAVHKLNWSKPV
jgi:hypothetical protein